MDLSNASQLLDLIVIMVCAIIGVGGVCFGGYQIFEGFTDDQPAAKKKGITILVVTVVSIAFIAAAVPIVKGIVGM